MSAIRKILPESSLGSQEQAEIVLELVYLMTVADGRMEERELAAFRTMVDGVRGGPVSEGDFVELLDRFAGPAHPEDIVARVKQIVPSLAPEHRELAFKLAIGLALSDGDAHDDENELVGVLFESLALDATRADALASEVRAAFASV